MLEKGSKLNQIIAMLAQARKEFDGVYQNAVLQRQVEFYSSHPTQVEILAEKTKQDFVGKNTMPSIDEKLKDSSAMESLN